MSGPSRTDPTWDGSTWAELNEERADGTPAPGPAPAVPPEPSTPAADAPVPLEAPARYTLKTLLGEGGMGRVWLAWDRELAREVAYKELAPGRAGTAAARRFIQEARLTARLEHPNIVPVYDAGERPDGGLYYVMAVVQGRSLRDALAEAEDLEGRLSLIDSLIDACQAVAHAHHRGVLHRDLKPDNILIGALGETLVVDWGVAKALVPDADDPGDTRAGAVVGSPRYMSPEQAAGRPVDARTDVWALGVILHELLAGRRFIEGRALELVARIARGDVPSTDDLQGPPELVAVARRALSVAPDGRYPDAAALLADLKAWRTGRRVSAYDYSPTEEILRLVVRYRWPLAGLAAGLSVAVLVAAGGYWRTTVARDRALAAESDALDARAEMARALQDAYISRAHRAVERDDPAAALTWAAAALELGPDPRARGIAAGHLRRVPYAWAGDRLAPPGPCYQLVALDADWLCLGAEGTHRFGDGEPHLLDPRRAAWAQPNPDHGLLVLSDGRSWLRVTDPRTGADLWTLEATSRFIGRTALSDGRMALPRDRLVELVDLATGEVTWATATASYTGGAAFVGEEVHVWLANGWVLRLDARTGASLGEWPASSERGIWNGAFSRDGRRLVFATMGGGIGILGADGARIDLRAHGSGAFVGWAGDEAAVWAADLDGISVWSPSGELLLHLPHRASTTPPPVAMRDGRRVHLLVDDALRSLEVRPREETALIRLPSGPASCAPASPKEQLCALGDGMLLRVDPYAPSSLAEIGWHKYRINSLCPTSIGLLATGGPTLTRIGEGVGAPLYDANPDLLIPLACGTADRWATGHGAELWLGEAGQRQVHALDSTVLEVRAWGEDWLVRTADGWEHRDPEGQLLATLPGWLLLDVRPQTGEVVRLKDDGVEVRPLAEPAPATPLTRAHGSARARWLDDRRLAVGDGTGVRILDRADGRLLASMTGHRGAVSLLDLLPPHPDRPPTLLSADHDGILLAWDLSVLDRSDEDLIEEIHRVTGLMVHGTRLTVAPR